MLHQQISSASASAEAQCFAVTIDCQIAQLRSGDLYQRSHCNLQLDYSASRETLAESLNAGAGEYAEPDDRRRY